MIAFVVTIAAMLCMGTLATVALCVAGVGTEEGS